jgi:hypothetical protein
VGSASVSPEGIVLVTEQWHRDIYILRFSGSELGSAHPVELGVEFTLGKEVK